MSKSAFTKGIRAAVNYDSNPYDKETETWRHFQWQDGYNLLHKLESKIRTRCVERYYTDTFDGLKEFVGIEVTHIGEETRKMDGVTMRVYTHHLRKEGGEDGLIERYIHTRLISDKILMLPETMLLMKCAIDEMLREYYKYE